MKLRDKHLPSEIISNTQQSERKLNSLSLVSHWALQVTEKGRQMSFCPSIHWIVLYITQQIKHQYITIAIFFRQIIKWVLDSFKKIDMYKLNLRNLNYFRLLTTFVDCSAKSQQIPRHLSYLCFSFHSSRLYMICKQSPGSIQRGLFSGVRINTLTCKTLFQSK